MHKKSYSHILFDADHTLFDFDESSRLSFFGMFKAMGYDLQEDDYTQYKLINKRIWNSFERGEVTQDEIRDKRWQEFIKIMNFDADPTLLNDHYLQGLVDNYVIFPGVIDLLEILNQGKISLSIITNGLKEVQRPRMLRSGLDRYFDHIIVSDEIGVAKPDKKYFDHVFEFVGRHAISNSLVVGDNLHSDIKGGRDYGVDTCWYNPSYSPNNSEIKPCYEIAEISDLLQIIR